MIPKKPFFLAVVVSITVFSVACFRSPYNDFLRAQQLESKGSTSAALHAYETLLPKLSPDDKRLQSEVAFHMGECLVRLDRSGEAYGAFQKAVELDDTNLAAHLRLGEFLLSADAPDKATAEAKRVLDASGGNNTEALALLGAAAGASGNSIVAEAAFTRVLQAEPGRLSISLALADVYNRSDRTEEARAVLKKASAAQPSSSMPLLALGRLEEQEGNPEAAEEAYRKAVAAEDAPESNLRLAQFLERAARIPEAEQVLRRVDSQRPAMPTALPDFEVISGRAPNALDRYLAALKSAPAASGKGAKQTLTSDPADAPKERVALAARLVEADLQAASTQQSGEKKASIDRAREHLTEYGKDMDAATLAILNAELALGQSDLTLAVEHAGKAVTIAPQSAAAHYVLGNAKYRAGDLNAARAEWIGAIDGDAHFVPARLALAADALSNSDPANAEHYIIPAVQDEPANLRALNLFARALAAQRRFAAAALIARRALAVDSTAAEPHLILGEIALQRHILSEALVQFEQAVVLEPHSRDAIEGLTLVYRHGAVSRTMLQHMEKIAAADPPSATLMEIAGRLFADHGWYADAERCLKEALSLDPQRSTAARALAKTFAATGQYSAAADSAARLGGDSAALLEAFRAEEREDTATAIRNYETAVRKGEKSGTAANNLAWLYAQQGTELERALDLAETAQSLNPSNPAVLDTLGVVHLRRREYSEAIQALETATRLAGTRPESGEREQLRAAIKHHLSEAYIRAGQPEAAAALLAEKR